MIASHVAVMEAIGRLSLALILGVLIGLELRTAMAPEASRRQHERA
jgi:hypothetical protein